MVVSSLRRTKVEGIEETRIDLQCMNWAAFEEEEEEGDGVADKCWDQWLLG